MSQHRPGTPDTSSARPRRGWRWLFRYGLVDSLSALAQFVSDRVGRARRALAEWYRDGQESDEVRIRKSLHFELMVLEERNAPSESLGSWGLPVFVGALVDIGYDFDKPIQFKLPDDKPLTAWLREETEADARRLAALQFAGVSAADESSRQRRELSNAPRDEATEFGLPPLGAGLVGYAAFDGFDPFNLAEPQLEKGGGGAGDGGGGSGGGGGGDSSTASFGRAAQEVAAGEMAGQRSGVDFSPWVGGAAIQPESNAATAQTAAAATPGVQGKAVEPSSAVTPAGAHVSATVATPAASKGWLGQNDQDPAGAWGHADEVLSRTPIRFEPNVGQVDAAVDYQAQGLGYQLWLTPTEAVMSLSAPRANAQSTTAEQALAPEVLHFRLVDSNPGTASEGLEQLEAKSNYFTGSDPSKWHTDVANYGKVAYHGAWNGIDVVYFGTDRKQLEFDVVVHAGADPSRAVFEVVGAQTLRVDGQGNLVIQLPSGGEVVQQAPILYQTIDGQRVSVEGQFVLIGGNRVGFTVGDYDRTRDLVIDPILRYGTYLGGSGLFNEAAASIKVDSDGNMYVTGLTASSDFPVYNPIYLNNPVPFSDVFVTKFTSTGTLAYSTYLGGNGGTASDQGNAIAIDSSGNVFVTGSTTSSDFPTTAGAFRTALQGQTDAFVTKINAAGNTLVYSTYLGGGDDDSGNGVAVNVDGEAVVVGSTSSINFPTASAYQESLSGSLDAFIVKLNAAGSTLVFGSYLGGTVSDSAGAVALDSSGNSYVVGQTFSTNFPTRNPRQGSLSGSSDAFVSRFSPSGSLQLSTYYGGSGADGASGVAVDSRDYVYITGSTDSTDLPTVNPGQSTNAGATDAFVMKWSSLSATPVYATYLGGGGDDTPSGIDVDADFRAVVTGQTASGSGVVFPQSGANQNFGGGATDAFITRLSSAGDTLSYSTFLGGSGDESGNGIAVLQDSIYVTGGTGSSNFPTKDPYDATLDGFQDAFVVKVGFPGIPVITSFATDTGASATDRITNDRTLSLSGTADANATVNLYYRRNGEVPLTSMGTSTANGSGAWTFDYTATTLAEGTYDFYATASIGGGESGFSAAFRVIVDLTPPALVLTLAQTNPTFTYDRTPTVHVTATDLYGVGATVVFDLDLNNDGDYLDIGETGYATITLDPTGNQNAKFADFETAQLAFGTVTFQARALDYAGNQGSTNRPIRILPGPAAITDLTLNKRDNGIARELLLHEGNVRLSVPVDLDISPAACGCQDPALVYNSYSVIPAPVVQAAVRGDNGSGVPTQILATLTWDSSFVSAYVYSTSGLGQGEDWIVARQVPPGANGQSTGRHTYTLDVYLDYGGGTGVLKSISDQTFVVNDTNSVFGAGWYFGNTDRLIDIPASGTYAAGKLRVLGRGGWLFYEQAGAAYVSPDGRGTLASVTGGYEFTAPNGQKRRFDSSGNMTKWTSTNGSDVFTYTYDGSNNLTGVASPDGALATFNYASGKVESIAASTGRRVTLAYSTAGDGKKDLTTFTNPLAESHTFVYDTNHRVTDETNGLLRDAWTYANHMVATVMHGGNYAEIVSPSLTRGLTAVYKGGAWADETSPAGATNKYLFTADGMTTDWVDGIGATRHYELNENGFAILYVNPLNKTTAYTRDASGYVTLVVAPDGGLRTMAYAASPHLLVSVNDERGNSTAYAYDDSSNLRTVTDALNRVMTYTWANGLLESVKDQLGKTSTSIYDTSRRLSAQVRPGGERDTFTYDANGNPETRKDALGNVATSVYDAANRLAKTIDALGSTTTYLYDPSGLQKGMINARGYGTSYNYDARGLQTSVVEAKGTALERTLSNVYDDAGRLTATVDALGRRTSFGYDKADRQITRTDATGATITSVYDLAGRLEATIDPLGRVTTFFYDDVDRQIATVDALGNRSTTIYDLAGNVTAYVDAKGNRTTQTYDALNRVIEVRDALDNRTSTVFDTVGRVSATVDALANRTTLIYDDNGRQTAVVDAKGGRNTSVYDAADNLIATLDPLGNRNTFVYDAEHRQTAMVDALNKRSTTVYDAVDNVVNRIDALNNKTTFVYDELNRQTTVIDALGNRSTTVYDAADQVDKTIDPRGNLTAYFYDNAGRLTGTVAPLGAGENFLYDKVGNAILRVVQGAGWATYFDALNRPVSQRDPLGNTATTVYDEVGNVSATVDPRGNRTTLIYDNIYRNTAVVNALNERSTTAYDAVGNVVNTIDARNNKTTIAYDELHRQVNVIDALGYKSTTVYDAASNVVNVIDQLGNKATVVYDALNRPKEFIDALGRTSTTLYDDASNALATIDAKGNRTSQVYDALNRAYVTIDALNQRTTSTFDAAGNLTAVQDARGNRTTWTYDALNRPITQKDALGNVATTVYDKLSRVVGQIDPLGNRTNTYFDKVGRMVESADALDGRLKWEYDAAGNVTASVDQLGNRSTQVYDALNRAYVSIDALNNRTTLTFDAAGNVTEVKNARGNTTTSVYDALNRAYATIDALGNRTTSTFDAAGNLTAVQDARGNRSTQAYDALNRTVATIDALNQRSTLAYDEVGNVVNAIDALNRTSTFVYDALYRQTTTIDAKGNRATAIYDEAGNVTSQIDPLGNRGTFVYDAINQQTVAIDALTRRTTSIYDAAGNLTATIDARGNRSTQAYDALNRVVASVDALNNRATAVYDAASNLVATVDPRGNRTTQLYDALNRAYVTIDALNNRTTVTFDAVGNATALKNARGNTTTSTYDALDRVIEVQDALGNRSTTIYDAVSNVSAQIDARGNRTTWTYDVLNRQETVKDALNGVATTTYDAVSNVVNTFDQLGRKTTYVYDELNRQVNLIDALGNKGTTAFDAASNVVNTIDALGNKTTFIYDELNRRKSTINALGDRSTVTFDEAGNVATALDELGRTTTFVYDELNRQKAVINAVDDRSTTTFDAAGNVTAQINERGYANTFTYDALNRVVAHTDPLNHTVTTVYDAVGNVSASIDALANRTTSTYDAVDRRVTLQKPSTGVWTTAYDAVGNATSSTDPLAHTTTWVYDELNRRTVEIDALTGRATSVYDAVGNRTVLIDPVGNRTTWTYDALNRVTQEADPLNKSATFAYDAASRQTSTTDRLGRRRDYTFDAVHQQTGEKWYAVGGALQNTITFTYDKVGNQLTATDSTGAYTLTYDDLNRVKTVAEPFALGLTFSYDAAGNRTVLEDDKGGLQTSTYDAANRLETRKQTGNGGTLRFDYTYTVRDQVETLKRYSDLSAATLVGTTSFIYDTTGRPTNQQHFDGANANFLNTTYAYDNADRLTVQTDNGTLRTFTYDNTDQVTADSTNTYTYDANGNRNNGSYAVGAANQITNDGTWTYTYDDAGNRTKKSMGASAETWSYQYDHLNHLTQVEKRSTDGGALQLRLAYTYDVYGNRLTRTEYDGSLNVVGAQRFGYDGWKTGPALHGAVGQENWDVWTDLDTSNALVTRRVFDNSVDALVARVSSAGAVAWYVTDRQGSVRSIANASGTLIDTLTYDGYGNVASESSPANGDRYKYTGRELETSATHLQFNRDNVLGMELLKWMSRDQIQADSKNLTRYAGNAPTNGTDPSGLIEPLIAAYQETAIRRELNLYARRFEGRPRDEHQLLLFRLRSKLTGQASTSGVDRELLVITTDLYLQRIAELEEVIGRLDERAAENEFNELEEKSREEQRTRIAFDPNNIPIGRIRQMIAEGKAVEHKGYVIIADAVGDKVAQIILEPIRKYLVKNPHPGEDFYGRRLNEWTPVTECLADRVAEGKFSFDPSIDKYRIKQYLPFLVEGSIDATINERIAKAKYEIDLLARGRELGRQIDNLDTAINVIKALPFGRMWDQFIKGNEFSAILSGAQDAVLLATFATAVPGLLTCNSSKLILKIAIGTDLGIAGIRGGQAFIAFYGDQDPNKALGYLGESILSLVGVGLNTLQLLRTVCFPAGTPVLTPDGLRSIEDLRPGDYVISRPEQDPESGNAAKAVTRVFARTARIWAVRFGDSTIATTSEHPFFVRKKGWVATRDLIPGDELFCFGNGQAVVRSVEQTDRQEVVYNLEVADYHTYYVGDTSEKFCVWVHNTCKLAEALEAVQKAGATGFTKGQAKYLASILNGNTADKYIKALRYLQTSRVGLNTAQAERALARMLGISGDELSCVLYLSREGRKVNIIPRTSEQTPDFLVDGVRTELKTISKVETLTEDKLSGALSSRIMHARSQAGHILVDVRKQSGMTESFARKGVGRAYGADDYKGRRIQSIRVIGNGFDFTVPRM